MGIIRQGSDAFDQAWTNFKDANPGANRTQKRKFVAAVVNRANEWLAKFDAQDNAAPADFAATRQAQFSTFLDTLSEPALDAVDPQS